MRLYSPFRKKKARIEIIPLIDIMFFLLASFMLASMDMILKMRAVDMNLPSLTARPGKAKLLTLRVNQEGDIFVENDPVQYNLLSLGNFLSNRVLVESNLSVYIKGDPMAKHGYMIGVLDVVHQVGVANVSYSIGQPPVAK